jgi:hypothetical protein
MFRNVGITLVLRVGDESYLVESYFDVMVVKGESG